MVDQEMLDAMRQLIDPIHSRLDTLEKRLAEETNNIKILLEVDVRRELNLLSEGHEMILERLPASADAEALEARLYAVEAVVRKHSKEIQGLKMA